MPFTNAGYDGTVDEVQFAKLLNRYAVTGPDDFKASAVAGADRTLSIADGTALGPGTLNVGTAFSPLQFEAVTSGTVRWDLVVLRRDWQPPGGVTELKVIKGGASQALPASGTSDTAWNQRPGIRDDQPLYLQQVTAGSTSLGLRVDLRVWQGAGGAEAGDKLALTYLASPGAAVKIGSSVHRYELQGNGVWGWREYPLAPLEGSYTPVWNGFEYRGDTFTSAGRYSVVGKRVRVQAMIQSGANPSLGLAPISFSLPPGLPTALGHMVAGDGMWNSSGTGGQLRRVLVAAGPDQTAATVWAVPGTDQVRTPGQAGWPWAAGHAFHVTLEYFTA